ncbi:MAG: TonB-dependent receptor [Candidatus Aminicenantes bacterium]|nr:TonB-dependent receptor [Candidatus Aminicenantes bacterium]
MKKTVPKYLLLVLFFFVLSSLILLAQSNEEQKQKQELKQEKITEQIVVTAKAPKELPLSKVTTIESAKIEKAESKDLSDIINYTTGVYVTEGNKNESRVQIRGFESKRITLLYDGIPVYEPYFNSFDLKSFSSEEIESVKVVRGASSVLYGPNTLGGIINVVTQRPEVDSFSLNTQFSGNKTSYVSGSGKWVGDGFSFLGNASYDSSDGFDWLEDGERTLRGNSDYQKTNFRGKMFFYPGSQSEIMAEVSYLDSEYGIPTAMDYYRQRYWRFDDWRRWQLNLGGTFAFFNTGTLKVRNYYVRHFNVLDAYSDSRFTEIRWESTYKNYSLGTFLIGNVPLSPNNRLRFSLNGKRDQVNTQDDVGEEWEQVTHNTYSFGIEDHIQISEKIKLIGGVSFDYLDKQIGQNKTSLNPIIGAKYNPKDWMDFYVSFSRKARFPSMKSLYSTSSGNPDLTEEIGQNYELGFTLRKSWSANGAVFINQVKDLINSIRLPSGYRSYDNLGEVEIKGFELGISHEFWVFDTTINYTYLDTENKDNGEPLDYTPKSQFNFFINSQDFKGLTFSTWGIAVSKSQALFRDDQLNIPGYFLLNAALKKRFSGLTLYLKAENLLNVDYFTEPGFPMKARTFSLGVNLKIGENGL